ncbi:antibiotic biosynthesis monooxygenase family protein [Xanthobacter sp. VNH20]|uniref:antibiotic biosynthesis monooxygenase family protein n=1 Tax=Xanthobacter sp. VNH20 TaxID=3156616 RepID=UPI0032B32940
MSRLEPLDERYPMQRQLGLEAAPVVLINLFTLEAAEEAQFLDAWRSDAAFMTQQPGCISTQLHRALGDSPMFLNYAVWGSLEAFRAARIRPDFVTKRLAYPASAVARPHLFQKLAVPGICDA